jgi:glycosyltransferase involved in cell wall biosynthesis
MKILISIGTLGLGGAEKQAVWLANKLSADHDVTLLTYHGGLREIDISAGVDWKQIPTRQTKRVSEIDNGYLDVSSTLEVGRFFEDNKPRESKRQTFKKTLIGLLRPFIPPEKRNLVQRNFVKIVVRTRHLNNFLKKATRYLLLKATSAVQILLLQGYRQKFISYYHPYKFTRSLIKESKADLVVTFLFHDTLLVGLSAILSRKRPKIIVGRRSPIGYGDDTRTRTQRKLLKFVYFFSDLGISNSKYNNSSAVADGLLERKIRVIHNYIEDTNSRLISNSTETFELLCISNFFEYKNHENFIRAVADSHFDSPYHVTFLGDGPLKTNIELLARKLGVNADFYSHEQQFNLTNIAVDYLVVPSFVEGNSNSLLEGLASGIVTRVGLVEELELMGAPLVIAEGFDCTSLQKSLLTAFDEVVSNKKQAADFKSHIVSEFGEDAIIRKWEKALGL